MLTKVSGFNSRTFLLPPRAKSIALYGRGWKEITANPLVLPSLDEGNYGADC